MLSATRKQLARVYNKAHRDALQGETVDVYVYVDCYTYKLRFDYRYNDDSRNYDSVRFLHLEPGEFIPQSRAYTDGSRNKRLTADEYINIWSVENDVDIRRVLGDF